MMANQHLELTGNVQAALLALENAQRRLGDSEQSQAIGVRRVILQDIEKLKALPESTSPGRQPDWIRSSTGRAAAVAGRRQRSPGGFAGEASFTGSGCIACGPGRSLGRPAATRRLRASRPPPPPRRHDSPAAPSAAAATPDGSRPPRRPAPSRRRLPRQLRSRPLRPLPPRQRSPSAPPAVAAAPPAALAAESPPHPSETSRAAAALRRHRRGRRKQPRCGARRVPQPGHHPAHRQPDSLLLSPEQKQAARENLKLLLLNARLNLLNRHAELFRQDVARVIESMQRLFDTEHHDVKTVIATCRACRRSRWRRSCRHSRSRSRRSRPLGLPAKSAPNAARRDLAVPGVRRGGVLALVLRSNHGNIAILWPPYRIELSSNMALVLTVLAFFVPSRGAARDRQDPRDASAHPRLPGAPSPAALSRALQAAVLASFEGRYDRAERLAATAVSTSRGKRCDTAASLVAARSAASARRPGAP